MKEFNRKIVREANGVFRGLENLNSQMVIDKCILDGMKLFSALSFHFPPSFLGGDEKGKGMEPSSHLLKYYQ